MIKNIVKGKHIFSRKAKSATEADKQVVTDLIDTLRANREICVGMAANMIGVNKSIISAYENQERLPSVAVLIKLSYEFNVSIEYLLGVKRNKFIDVSKLNDKQVAALTCIAAQFEEDNYLINKN